MLNDQLCGVGDEERTFIIISRMDPQFLHVDEIFVVLLDLDTPNLKYLFLLNLEMRELENSQHNQVQTMDLFLIYCIILLVVLNHLEQGN